MREAERDLYGLAATANPDRPDCDPNFPAPSHPRSVTLPYSEVHVIDRLRDFIAYITLQVFSGILIESRSHIPKVFKLTTCLFF